MTKTNAHKQCPNSLFEIDLEWQIRRLESDILVEHFAVNNIYQILTNISLKVPSSQPTEKNIRLQNNSFMKLHAMKKKIKFVEYFKKSTYPKEIIEFWELDLQKSKFL